MNVRDIYRPQWSGLATPEAVWDGIRLLERCNMARVAQKDTGGRQADVIQLHPSLKRVVA